MLKRQTSRTGNVIVPVPGALSVSQTKESGWYVEPGIPDAVPGPTQYQRRLLAVELVMTKEVIYRHMVTHTPPLIISRYAETPDPAPDGNKETLQVQYIHPSQN